MWAESSPVGVMTEVMFFFEVQIEKATCRGNTVSLQVNLYFLIRWTSCCGILLWELSISTVNTVRKNDSLITKLFLSDQENQSTVGDMIISFGIICPWPYLVEEE